MEIQSTLLISWALLSSSESMLYRSLLLTLWSVTSVTVKAGGLTNAHAGMDTVLQDATSVLNHLLTHDATSPITRSAGPGIKVWK
jgi:hypothetical protein